MAPLDIFAGTWEELAAYAETFQGRQLRRMVLSRETTPPGSLATDDTLGTIALSLFTAADSLVRALGTPRNDPYTAAVGELIAQQYRAMG